MRYLFSFLVVVFLVAMSACSSHKPVQYLGYIEGRYIYLSSKSSGKLLKLPVRKGQQVAAHTLAYDLDPQPELSQLKEAKALLQAAIYHLRHLESMQKRPDTRHLRSRILVITRKLTFLKNNYEKNVVLRRQGVISQADMDRAKQLYLAKEAELKTAKAGLAEGSLDARVNTILAQKERIKAAKAKVMHLEWLLAQKQGHIPKAGMIADVFYQVGEMVPAHKPIVSLLTPENRILVFFIPEQKLSQLKVGRVVHFTCDGCQRSVVSATVDYIGSRAEFTSPVNHHNKAQGRLVYYVEAVIDPAEASQFHPGQPVRVMVSVE